LYFSSCSYWDEFRSRAAASPAYWLPTTGLQCSSAARDGIYCIAHPSIARRFTRFHDLESGFLQHLDGSNPNDGFGFNHQNNFFCGMHSMPYQSMAGRAEKC
jgi:hypothetical protein